MKKITIGIIACLFFSLAQSQNRSITGFSIQSAQEQFLREDHLDKLVLASNIDQYDKEMSAQPHHVGSPGGKKVADYIFQKFKSWGYDVDVETFYVLFPTPKNRLLEMTSPARYKALLAEPPLKEDKTSGQTNEQLPTYNCYSPDGDVAGELVYVNYGIPQDYERLDRMGITVKGKIVIARYGSSWRGIKPKLAWEHGAIGCIIYSDPKDDGYFRGDVYPKGAYRNEFGVQRGSVMDLPIYPGDPLTPNIGATRDAHRLDQKEAGNLLKIPVLPISYHDAEPLLRSLEGPVAPEDWRGGLPFTYHIGDGQTRVHLKLEFNWEIRPINNIIAKWKGSAFPDEWIIRGNHHDAWVNGAADPLSGQAALLEEARALSELAKSGWKPQRTLVYCAWDGEEPALLGSTEWVENHADELKKKAVIYVNSDVTGRGYLNAEGSHALEPFLNEVAREVTDPEMHISILDRRLARDIVAAGNNSKSKKELMERKSFDLGAMGSGSDYSPFIHHIGISSLDLGFGGEDGGGEYHSIYDSYDDYSRFKDPGFVYGAVLAKTAGRIMMRMAEARLLPFDFRALYKTLNGYASDLITLVDQMREDTRLENALIRQHAFAYASDPMEKTIQPSLKDEIPFLSFSALQNALHELQKVADQLADSLSKTNLPESKLDAINQGMYHAEQQLLLEKGLPGRSWYKHDMYAPGLYTGYGVKTLPGIREAIEQRQWKTAQEQIEVAAQVIRNFSEAIRLISQEIP
ncbi:MAG: transferrin receptor-like dimerization domain-containing protein [Chitinophagales bacterium]